MFRYEYLRRYPSVFVHLTGLRLSEFEALAAELVPTLAAAHRQKLATRPQPRLRAVGGGTQFTLDHRDQLLLGVLWLRRYLTHELMGYGFGVDATTVGRILERVLPPLEASGRDTMRMPDPGRKRRVGLDELLQQTPAVAVIVDSFEQRVQKPRSKSGSGSGSGSGEEKSPAKRAKDSHYSGKKKQHTLKSQVSIQVSIDEESGTFVDVSESVPGPTADRTLLERSTLLERLPEGVGALGDLAYLGLDKAHPQGLAASPRRKPRGKDRPPEDVAYNRAFASRRIRVEHTIGRARRFQCLTQTDRHHRKNHTARVVAVAGLVNRQLHSRHPYLFN